jgi:Pyruvate/2-oxoacid:ferredoxin oxidoreductase gamma subunit
VIIYNRDRLPEDFAVDHARVLCVPASEIADAIGSAKVANVVMLGAMLDETECLPAETAMDVLQDTVRNQTILELNRKALNAGREYVDHMVRVGAVSGPDGFAY